MLTILFLPVLLADALGLAALAALLNSFLPPADVRRARRPGR
jgi:hypothetical protein